MQSHVISMTPAVINKALNAMYEMQTFAIHLSNNKNTEKTSLKDTEKYVKSRFFFMF